LSLWKHCAIASIGVGDRFGARGGRRQALVVARRHGRMGDSVVRVKR